MLQNFIDDLNQLPFLDLRFLSNSLADYVVALLIFLLTYVGIHLAKTWLVAWLRSFVSKTKNRFDDLLLNLLEVIHFPFYLTAAIFIATRYLTLDPTLDNILRIAAFAVGYIYLTLGLQHAIASLLEAFTIQEGQEPDGKRLDRGTADFVRQFLTGVIWLIVFLTALSNFGYDISTLIGGLGIAGIVLGFALQNVLSDIFAYFTINLDKPFKKGDFIIVGEDKGRVKQIGLKNTRVKTLQGQDLIMTNRELTDARINNYATMSRRRIEFKISVTYDTPEQLLPQIPKMVEEIIRDKEDATFDRANLKELAEYSLIYEVVYHLETPNYNTYMQVNEQILLEIIQEFKKQGIRFAYPTREININQSA
jgi:small-conductance mechanosensitive channel